MKNEDFSNLQIIRIHKNHCYLYNTFSSVLGSVFTVPLTGNSLTHDWIVLEVRENVKKKNIYEISAENLLFYNNEFQRNTPKIQR